MVRTQASVEPSLVLAVQELSCCSAYIVHSTTFHNRRVTRAAALFSTESNLCFSLSNGARLSFPACVVRDSLLRAGRSQNTDFTELFNYREPISQSPL